MAKENRQMEISKKANRPSTLQDKALQRALKNSKPKVGTPHDWEDYERQQNSEGEQTNENK